MSMSYIYAIPSSVQEVADSTDFTPAELISDMKYHTCHIEIHDIMVFRVVGFLVPTMLL